MSLVPVAHLFFCDFSHPYSSLKDESIEFPFVQPMLAKGLGVGRRRAIGQRLNYGTLSCPHRSTCGSWVWHFLLPTFLAWGPEPVHFRAVPYATPAWSMYVVSVSSVWGLQLYTHLRAMHSSNYALGWHQSQQLSWASLLCNQEGNDSQPPESGLFFLLARGFC